MGGECHLAITSPIDRGEWIEASTNVSRSTISWESVPTVM